MLHHPCTHVQEFASAALNQSLLQKKDLLQQVGVVIHGHIKRLLV
jgi:hypothetical protein